MRTEEHEIVEISVNLLLSVIFKHEVNILEM